MRIRHEQFTCAVIAAALVSSSANAMDPSKSKYQALLNAGEQADITHDYHAAEMNYRLAAAEAEKFGARSREVQETQARLASMYVLQDQFKLAEPHFQRAKSIAIELKASGHGDPETLVWLDDLADSYQLKAATKDPAYCYSRCLELRKAISPKNKKIAQCELEMGNFLMASGKEREAISHLKYAYELYQQQDGIKNITAGNACLSLANACRQEHNYKLAEKYCNQALAAYLIKMGTGHYTVANVKRLHAIILDELQQYADALKEIHDTIAIREKHPGIDTCEVGTDYGSLAKISFHQGDLVQAELAARKALALLKQCKVTNTALRLETMTVLYKILLRNHHLKEATQLDTEMKALEPKAQKR